MTEVERFNDGTGAWDPIDYGSFNIEFGVSDILIAPQATVTAARTSPVSAGERIRVREDGVTTFEGRVQRTKPRTKGPMRIEAEHDAHALFDDTVTLNVSGTDEDVLSAALSDADPGAWTLTYVGTPTTLGDDYAVEGRSVKRVFRDMVDRTGRVWWVGVDHTITVAEYGAGGQLAAVDTATDDAAVSEYVPDDIETVLNDVTVVGTGGEKVTGSASDSGSISEYGRQPERLNVSYIESSSEADAYAAAVLNPQPDAAASVRVGASVGPVASPVVNQTLDVTDTQGTGMDESLVIEKQTVQQGVAELALGEGAGTNVEKFNRREKSKGDVTEPGSVYGEDRIAEGSIVETKLEDLSVSVDKIQDGAVQEAKVFAEAISETKIRDDAISTPKLQAGSITAGKIDADAVTATAIAADAVEAGKIDADAVGAREIIASSITADEIDTLDLDTGQLSILDDPTFPDSGVEFAIDANGRVDFSPINDTERADIGFENDFATVYGENTVARTGLTVGTPGASLPVNGTATFSHDNAGTTVFIAEDGGEPSIYPAFDERGRVGHDGNAWRDVWAYQFFDADTNVAINDGGDPMEGVAEGHGPPDSCAVCDDETGEVKGHSINQMAREAWDVIREQARRIEDLEARVDDLEDGANA